MVADDKTKRGPADRARINSQEDYELEYRAKEWGVSKERVREAVQAVGPIVDDSQAASRRVNAEDREEQSP